MCQALQKSWKSKERKRKSNSNFTLVCIQDDFHLFSTHSLIIKQLHRPPHINYWWGPKKRERERGAASGHADEALRSFSESTGPAFGGSGPVLSCIISAMSISHQGLPQSMQPLSSFTWTTSHLDKVTFHYQGQGLACFRAAAIRPF